MRILAGATTVLRRIVDLGLVSLIVVVLFTVVLAKGAPLVGRQAIVVGGGSMEPAIGLGSAIVVRPIEPAALAVGDVVSMNVSAVQATYTHRIIAVVDRPDGRWIRTQGDVNATPDPNLVHATAVIGRVEFVVPWAGYLVALLSLPTGVMFVLGLAATLLAIAWLLESLELDRRPTRRAAADGVPDAGSPAASEPVSASSPDRGLLNGEPIAARHDDPGPPSSTGPVWSAAVGMGPSTMATAVAAARRALVLAERSGTEPPQAPVARPTVREQLARSRETRNQRARWQIGRAGNRPVTD